MYSLTSGLHETNCQIKTIRQTDAEKLLIFEKEKLTTKIQRNFGQLT